MRDQKTPDPRDKACIMPERTAVCFVRLFSAQINSAVFDYAFFAQLPSCIAWHPRLQVPIGASLNTRWTSHPERISLQRSTRQRDKGCLLSCRLAAAEEVPVRIAVAMALCDMSQDPCSHFMTCSRLILRIAVLSSASSSKTNE